MYIPSPAEAQAYQDIGEGAVDGAIEGGRWIGALVRRSPLAPGTRALPSYDCPTGTCRTDKVCEEVNDGDTIDPNSREHVERNACNRCPSVSPTPMTRIRPKHGRNPETTVFSHYEDNEGNHWLPDSWFTAPRFHGDAGVGARDPENMTYRVGLSLSGGRGWQCRYYNGALDDTSLDLGTFDYADGGTLMHKSMDVDPHYTNPNYAPNLTEQF